MQFVFHKTLTATDRRTDGQNAKLIGSFFQNKLPKKGFKTWAGYLKIQFS